MELTFRLILLKINLKVNIFARIIPIEQLSGDKVKYYSIQFEDSNESEFIDFLERMEPLAEIEEDINILIAWLQNIANDYGAQAHLFRQEREADALPPPRKQMKLYEHEINEQLRLYCLRANVQVVFLFNGGVKTTQKAQDCPNVSRYFLQANLIANSINQLFQNGEITWNENDTDIIYDEDLDIEI